MLYVVRNYQWLDGNSQLEDWKSLKVSFPDIKKRYIRYMKGISYTEWYVVYTSTHIRAALLMLT